MATLYTDGTVAGAEGGAAGVVKGADPSAQLQQQRYKANTIPFDLIDSPMRQ